MASGPEVRKQTGRDIRVLRLTARCGRSVTVKRVNPEQIATASRRLEGHIRSTPVLTADGSDFGWVGPVQMKLEHLQHSGSFKARGAANALLTTEVPAAGVVAASGGNHGAAVAWAADRLGHRATVFVPSIASPAKIAKLESYGADVHIVGQVFAEALEASREFQADTGALSVHAYDQAEVLAGAGTVGAEFEAQVEPLDRVLVACGGGGLSGGLAAWFGHRVALTVVETEGTQTFASALKADRPIEVAVEGLAADSLGATMLGTAGWDQLRAVSAESTVVSDREVREAQRLLWDRYRLLVEPAAAAPLAALAHLEAGQGENVGVIVCGANTDRLPG